MVYFVYFFYPFHIFFSYPIRGGAKKKKTDIGVHGLNLRIQFD